MDESIARLEQDGICDKRLCNAIRCFFKDVAAATSDHDEVFAILQRPILTF